MYKSEFSNNKIAYSSDLRRKIWSSPAEMVEAAIDEDLDDSDTDRFSERELLSGNADMVKICPYSLVAKSK